ncbi:MAG: hypothetical protein V4864_01720 [Pseudomonadota bacterium]
MRFRPAFRALAFVLCGLAAAGPAAAQSLILRPAVVPLAGQTGQSVSQALTLQNDSDQPLDFVLEAKDVVVQDGKRVFVDAGKLADSIAASAVFTPARVTVPPHASASVQAMFTLPAAMRHRAVAAYFRGTTPVRSGNRTAFMSLGTLFTFTISDRISVAAGTLQAEPPSGSANAQLRSRLVNDGSEPVVPSGMAVILDAQGRMVGKAPFKQHRLLPGEAATLVAEYPGELGAGTYRAIATFDIGGRPLTLSSPLNVQ